jgi:hypothetical protein
MVREGLFYNPCRSSTWIVYPIGGREPICVLNNN